MELTSTGHNVLAGLLDGAHHERVGLGQTLQTLDQLGQVSGVLRLHGDTHDGRHGVLHVAQRVRLLAVIGDRGGLDNELVNADQTADVTARHVLDGLLVATHHQHRTLHRLVLVQVLLLAVHVVVTHDADLLAAAHLTGEDTAEREEAALVRRRHHLADVQHERGVLVAVLDTHEVLVVLLGLAGVEHLRAVGLRLLGGGQVLHDHLQQRLGGRQELHHDRLHELLRDLLALLRRDLHVQRLEHLVHLVLLLRHDGVEDLVDGVQAELAEGAAHALAVRVRLGADPLLVLGIEERVTPQALAHLSLVRAELRGVHAREAGHGEGPGLQTGADGHGALIGRDLQVTHAGVVVRRNDDVHVLQGLDEALVGLLGVELELQDGAVHLVDEHDGADTLRQGLAQHRLGLHAHALHAVHDDQRTVRHTEGGSHLRAEVNVPGRVDQVDQEVALLVVQALHDVFTNVVVHRDGSRLDRDTAGNFVRAGVHDTLVTGVLHLDDTSGTNEGVRQSRLAVIDVGNHGHVTDLVREVHEGTDIVHSEVHHFDWGVTLQ
mmetsp:Transcript_12758/g.23769  ORF Transcript_12758/g.23769 Transcript_12758/m.23769 type:complete len:548 (-) Transcript_12758:8-1651(-)